jgi:predicted PolB exonuclease-like 3'-5' exonuclease
MKPVLVFDIETIPDVPGLRRLHELDPALSDAEVAEMAFQQRRAQSGNDFLPLHLQRVAVISCALRVGKELRVWSLAEPEQGEAEIIQRFFDGVEKFTPQIVSWNGGGFDLPVLHYRGLIHGVVAPRYWDLGDGDYGDSRDFKWNNYISRYHLRHLDLMDLLAMYQPKNNAPLDAMAKLCGFPGKLGMDGSMVYSGYLDGKLDDIRRYCETDVMNTYLVYCRFQKMRGGLLENEYDQEIALVKETLGNLAPTESHWDEYLKAWV